MARRDLIFIIGGRGLVGSAFVRACEASGRAYAILDRASYRDYAGQRCDLLINANGNSRKPLATENPLADFDASVRTVRESLIDFRFARYIHLSSCDVYPDCSSPATTQEGQFPAPALQSPYGFHKFLAEQSVQHAASNWLIFRLGGFVGPGLRKNAIFDILHGGPLWLDPASELQFLHTDDAARIVMSLADAGVSGEVFNLCGRGGIALREVMERVGEVPLNPGGWSYPRPCVRYDVSIDKISRLVEVPETRQTVLSFVDQYRGQ